MALKKIFKKIRDEFIGLIFGFCKTWALHSLIGRAAGVLVPFFALLLYIDNPSKLQWREAGTKN